MTQQSSTEPMDCEQIKDYIRDFKKGIDKILNQVNSAEHNLVQYEEELEVLKYLIETRRINLTRTIAISHRYKELRRNRRICKDQLENKEVIKNAHRTFSNLNAEKIIVKEDARRLYGMRFFTDFAIKNGKIARRTAK